jgi:hypothetical protein
MCRVSGSRFFAVEIIWAAICSGPFYFAGALLVNGNYLKLGPAFLRLIGADIAGDKRTVITAERQIAGRGGNCVRQSKLKRGQGVQHNGITGIVGDSVATQAVEQRAEVDQNSNAGITGNGNPAVDVAVGMVGDFDSPTRVAVDLGSAGPLAVAALTAMNTEAGVAVDDSIRHEHCTGMDNLQTKRPTVESDLVVAIDIGFTSIENRNPHSAVVADDIRGPGRPIATIQDQMSRAGAYTAAPIVGNVHAGIKIECAAAHADAGPGAVGD